MTLKGHAKFGPKLNPVSKSAPKQLINFYPAVEKSPNFIFDSFLLSEK